MLLIRVSYFSSCCKYTFDLLERLSGTVYHNFSVRTLYRHVLNAIKGSSAETPENPKSPSKSTKKQLEFLDDMALRLSIAHQTQAFGNESVNAQAKNRSNLNPASSPQNLAPINERETTKCAENPEITYRERLGGYLHPRDMRKLVTPFSASNEPQLIVRRHAMLLILDPLRAIILRSR